MALLATGDMVEVISEVVIDDDSGETYTGRRGVVTRLGDLLGMTVEVQLDDGLVFTNMPSHWLQKVGP